MARDCTWMEDRLDDHLDGTLPPVEAAAARAHLQGCPRCRHLISILEGRLQALPDEPPPDLAAAVLARTSGPTCAAAAGRLCDLVDGALDGVDAAVVRAHLDHCTPCEALACALSRLHTDLPRLALMEPGEDFTDAVAAATLPLGARLRRRLRRLGAASNRLLQRPRLAWEGAYVGALLLALLFGAPASPLRGVPDQILAISRTNPIDALMASPVGDAGRQVSSWSHQAWSATRRGVTDSAAGMSQAARSRWQRAGGASADLRRHLGGAVRALAGGQFRQSLRELSHVGGNIKIIFTEFLRSLDGAADSQERNTP